MAKKQSISAAEWERERRRQKRETEQHTRNDLLVAKATERTAREQHVTDQRRLTQEQTRRVEERQHQLLTLLHTGLSRSAKIEIGSLKRRPPTIPFDAVELARPTPEPTWDQFSPAAAGPLSRIVGGKARQEQQQERARAAYEQAVHAWQERESERERLLTARRSDHQQRMSRAQAQVDDHNKHVDKLARDAAARDRKAIETMLDLTLKRVPLPDDFPRRAEVTFNPTSDQVVVQVQLPARDVVPDIRAYKYIQVRDEIQPVPRPVKEAGDIYRSVIAQVALLVLRDLFDGDRLLTSIALNGHVDAVNPGTGQGEYPCLISLNVDRETFEQLVLAQVQPEVCLRHLRALVSSHPYELEAIVPILDFDRSKYSFVAGLDAVSSLDSRPDLMQMHPTEFEHLVRQIFEAMDSMEGWTTEQNYDDGVDAVVFNKSPMVGGLSIVQAKRYKDAVGVRQRHATTSQWKRPGRPPTVHSIRVLVLHPVRENPAGAIGVSTANSPPSASRSQPPPRGRSSRPRASIPHRTERPAPGPTSFRGQIHALLAVDFIETITLTGQRQHILAVIEHATRRIRILGTTAHPTAVWVSQMARNLAMDLDEAGAKVRYLTRDQDAKHPALFDRILSDTGIEIVPTGDRMPHMNSIMERWVRTRRHEPLDRTLTWNEHHLGHCLRQFELHDNERRPHQARRCIRPRRYGRSLHRSPTRTVSPEWTSAATTDLAA